MIQRVTPPVTSPLPARAWPRWSTLVVLTLAVVGAHLVLLAGGLPSWAAHTPAVLAPSLATASDALAQTLVANAALPRPAAVLTSQVRWIVPPVAQPPMASQPEPPVAEAMAPHPKPRPPPAPSLPAPETTSVATVPIPEPARMPEPPEIERPPDNSAESATAAAPAEIREAAPEPTSEAQQTADDSSVLAKATTQRDTASTSANEASKANAQPGPAQPPASAQLNYNVEGQSKGLTYNATGLLDWRNEGSTYSARMEIRMFLLGSRVQTSKGQLTATGLQPERFGDKSRSERAAHFDRSQNRIRFSNNAPDAELMPGAQDRLSVFLQLAGLLNSRPEAFAAGQSIDIPVAGTSSSETWRFQVQGLASLDLPAGSVIARHLVREPREPRDTRVDIWLAPSLGHLPVRIRLTQDNGDVVDQRLTSLP